MPTAANHSPVHAAAAPSAASSSAGAARISAHGVRRWLPRGYVARLPTAFEIGFLTETARRLPGAVLRGATARSLLAGDLRLRRRRRSRALRRPSESRA